MLDTKVLRGKILQLAMQGRLVEQRTEEGTARDLYNRIQEKKKKLINEKKVKKEKSLAAIKEDEIPFDIPDTWSWCHLSDVCLILNGDRGKNYPSKNTLTEEGIPFVSALNINNGTIIKDDNLKCMTPLQYDRLGAGKLVKGDVVLCIRGSLGKHGVYPFSEGAIASSLVILRDICCNLLEYISFYLDSSLFQSEISKYVNGVAQPNLAAKDLSKFLIPLPPTLEQKRIVEKIAKLFTLLDSIDENMESYDRELKKLNQKILEAAIQGKLVEQRAEDGSAEELYHQIQLEKQNFIAKKIIKQDKALDVVQNDEIPFEIPDSWKWVRLGDITTYCQKKIKISRKDILPNMWSLDLEDIEKETGKILKKCLASQRNITGDKVVFEKGQILYSKLRPYLKKVLVAPDKGIATSEIVPFQGYAGVSSQYLVYVLTSPYIDYVINSVTYGVKMPRVGTDTMANLIIPLPPLKEQYRIVNKIEKLLPLCDSCIN